MKRLFWTLCVILSFVGIAGAHELPATVRLPPAVQIDFVEAHDWGEAEMPLPGEADPAHVVRGRRWHAGLVYKGLSEEVPGKAVWARIKPTWLAAGWTVVHEFDSTPFHVTLRRTPPEHSVWAHVNLGSAAEMQLTVIDTRAAPGTLTLAAPGLVPENINPARGDIPYLTPPKGAKVFGEERDPTPFYAVFPDSPEPELVATSQLLRRYHVPGMSKAHFVELYRHALRRAGWSVLVVQHDLYGATSQVLARYAQGPRDLWAQLTASDGDITLAVADLGADDLAAQLRRNCQATLQGVLFDFNHATIKPPSQATLMRVRDALRAQDSQAFEVAGHTDHVGNAAYNQKLSLARATAVMRWLLDQGIASTQLKARGYGMTKPVAGNDSSEGRARNRRVELLCLRQDKK